VLLGGAAFIFMKARQKAPVAETAPAAPVSAEAGADPELARYLERIRRDSGGS
jgi:hypothetical protein